MPCITLSDIGEDMYSKEDVDRLVEAALEWSLSISPSTNLTPESAALYRVILPFRQQQPKKVVPDNVPMTYFTGANYLVECYGYMRALEAKIDSLAAKVK